MITCYRCRGEVDPAKDFFLRAFERKGPAVDFCSLVCLTEWYND